MFTAATFMESILSRNVSLAYRLVTTALKEKYGSTISLATYDDILQHETSEEYADVKSKASFDS